METHTLGSKIAKRRRMMGLSQEGFGEQMGVSRQAISKWESDVCLPEVEKLVTMSQIFGVSVGWLLGTEEEIPIAQILNAGDPMGPMQELEPPAPEKTPQGPKRTRKGWIRSAVGAAVCAVLALGAWRGHDADRAMEQRLGTLEQQLARSKQTIDDLDLRFEDLKDQNLALSEELASILETMVPESGAGEGQVQYESLKDWSLTAVAEDTLDEVTVRCSGITARDVQGVRFVVKYEGVLMEHCDCEMEGRSFLGTLQLHPLDGYEYILMLDGRDGMSEQIQLMGHGMSQLREGTTPQLHTVRNENTVFDNHSSERFWMGWKGVSLSVPTLVPQDVSCAWEGLKVSYYHNGDRVTSVTLVLEELDLAQRSLYFQIPSCTYEMVSFLEGDMIELRLEGVLKVGMEASEFSVPMICWKVHDEDLEEVRDLAVDGAR